ncbi:MAG: hypothetical protein J1F31_06790 [Erysipelotrichales bacterium]|nr:hypothetical protein [Erysipelotrichales bacterium]
METHEIIEFVCTIISTLSIILSAILICHHFLYKITLRAVYDNGYLKIYASALQHKIVLRGIQIKVNKKIVNENDIFLAGGKEKLELDVGKFTLIKMVSVKSAIRSFVMIVIDTEIGNKIKRIVRIRRK